MAMPDANWVEIFTQTNPGITVCVQPHGMELVLTPDRLLKVVGDLKAQWVLAGLMAEDDRDLGMRLRYVFYGCENPWLALIVKVQDTPMPSISKIFFAADWQEREIEDLFDIRFEGHPQLGNFVLHNEDWPEKTAPMRQHPPRNPERNPQWEDAGLTAIVEAPGSFVMPIGPVYSGVAESVQFSLGTVGEEIIFAHIRPFYKYRVTTQWVPKATE
jgi:Ni,Fe-hydrogenase III component G